MKKIILLLLLPFSFIAQTLTVQAPLRFLALGDSYTIGQSVPVNQRWPVQLKDSLATRGILTDTMRIIATTGWRTDNLINAITNQHLQQQNYNLVSLLIGVNNQYQGVPVSQYRIEFPQLLDSAIRYAGGDTSHVFVVSIPDYAYTSYGQGTGNQTQISQEIDQYNQINKQFADSFHIRYFDITPISRLGLLQPNLVASDGLHPSGIQYSEWVKLMLQYISGSTVTSIKENEDEINLSIYPNPAADIIYISCNNTKGHRLEVYDNTGRLIINQEIISETTHLSLKELSEGIYAIRVVGNNTQVTKKIVKD
ncbi:MAG: GDSL-type esterase/lipase family protein [Bacteroidota bacterium]